MRIIFVWVTAIALLFMVTLSWYVTLPGIIGFSRALNSTYYADANARSIATGVEYAAISWGAIFDIFIICWALISSAKRDVESEIYG